MTSGEDPVILTCRIQYFSDRIRIQILFHWKNNIYFFKIEVFLKFPNNFVVIKLNQSKSRTNFFPRHFSNLVKFILSEDRIRIWSWQGVPDTLKQKKSDPHHWLWQVKSKLYFYAKILRCPSSHFFLQILYKKTVKNIFLGSLTYDCL